MRQWFLTILLVTTLAELAIYVELIKYAGILPTLLLILGTGLAGVILARQQGIGILVKAREEIVCGRIPGNEMLDGVIILTGAVLLIIPGVLSALAGLILLIPFTRLLIREYLKKRLRHWIDNGRVNLNFKIR